MNCGMKSGKEILTAPLSHGITLSAQCSVGPSLPPDSPSRPFIKGGDLSDLISRGMFGGGRKQTHFSSSTLMVSGHAM